LSLDRIQVRGSLFLDDGFLANGQVRLRGAVISGLISLTGAVLNNPNNPSVLSKDALVFNNTQIGGDVFLDDNFQANGQVSAVGATIAGQLKMKGAILNNPVGNALNLDEAVVRGQTVIALETLVGDISASHAHLAGLDLTVSRATAGNVTSNFRAPNAYFDRSGLSINSATRMDLYLENAQINHLKIACLEFIALMGVMGWSVGSAHGALLQSASAIAAFLDTHGAKGQGRFIAQPWKALAAAIEQSGEPEHARRLRWAAARRTTQTSPLGAKLLRAVYGLTVGYGYYPMLTLVWLGILFLATLTIALACSGMAMPSDFDLAQGLLSAKDRASADALVAGYPAFDPLLYSLDIALPVFDTGQSKAWNFDSSPSLVVSFGAIKAFSWALTALLIAGITGILRKN
jgi:hypothetical protein